MVFSSDEDESYDLECYDAALRNPLILQQIFTYLPTQFLLSSCSLVNKLWNREARTFIRDHRICLKNSYHAQPDTICKFLADFNKLCDKTKSKGREIPWNGLKITFHTPSYNREQNLQKSCDGSSKTGSFHFKSDWKLQYLEIAWGSMNWEDCRIHLPLYALFRTCAPHLRTLKLNNLLPHPGNLIISVVSEFPKLEYFAMSNSYLREDELRIRWIVKALIERAPNLKKIAAETVQDLAVYPEDSYGLLDELEFRFRSIQDVSIYERVLETRPPVRKLMIFGCGVPFIGRLHDMNRDENMERRFHSTLQLLLHACSQSLCKMVMNDVHPWDSLSFPALISLRHLKFTNLLDQRLQGLWNFISSIDLDQNLPNLEEMKIGLCPTHIDGSMEVVGQEESENYIWPDFCPNLDHRSCPPCSRSLNLKLEVNGKNLNLPRIHSKFPNLKLLHLQLNNLRSDPCPLVDICRLWPELQELKIVGYNNKLERNYDADFCGIHQEEVELLGHQSDRYLKNVNIVPIKPCLLTMSDLRKAYISIGFNPPSCQPQGSVDRTSLKFTTRVTELVALMKMKNVSVWGDNASSLNSWDDLVGYQDAQEPSLFEPLF